MIRLSEDPSAYSYTRAIRPVGGMVAMSPAGLGSLRPILEPAMTAVGAMTGTIASCAIVFFEAISAGTD